MSSKIQSIDLDKLVPHPDNPNKMSKAAFAKLVRNIERTGRYEPLIIRPCQLVARSSSLACLCDSRRKTRQQVARCNKSTVGGNNEQRTTNKEQHFQIINGHHRWLALKELGHKKADVIVWDIDDAQADIFLATLNRLCGQDVLDKKIALLKRLSEKVQPVELAKLLPQTKAQLEKLTQLTTSEFRFILRSTTENGLPIEGGKSEIANLHRTPHGGKSKIFLNPLVFFISDSQQRIIEAALSYALQNDKGTCHSERSAAKRRISTYLRRPDSSAAPQNDSSKAAKRASALSAICRYYLDHEQ